MSRFLANLRQWWKWHEGWLAAALLGISAFVVGWSSNQLRNESVMAKESLNHAQEMQHVVEAYREALSAKDHLIAAMANQSADAASSSAQAAEAAAKAANKARDEKAELGKLR